MLAARLRGLPPRARLAVPAAAVLLLVAGVLGLGRPGAGNGPAPASRPQIVFAEFGQTADHLYVATADDPARRTLVQTVQHAEGWGINPGAMRGQHVAYTVLPAGSAPQREAPAELWVLNVATREQTRLARDADLLVPPQFVDDGTLIYRRSDGDRQAIVRVDIGTQARTSVYEERTGFGILPIGYDASGSLLFSRLSSAGTDVYAVRSGEQPVLLFHASNEIARDWRLSPDGRALAFLAPEQRAERVVYRAQVVALSAAEGGPIAGGVQFPEISAQGEQYGLAWMPDGQSLAVGQEAREGASPVALLRPGQTPATLMPPMRGFDVPVAWSASGEYLAVRTFDGANSTNPGRESAVVIAADGQRFPVHASGEVILVGWLTNA